MTFDVHKDRTEMHLKGTTVDTPDIVDLLETDAKQWALTTGSVAGPHTARLERAAAAEIRRLRADAENNWKRGALMALNKIPPNNLFEKDEFDRGANAGLSAARQAIRSLSPGQYGE